jgi:preprotein translocase subunit SecA
MPFPVDEDEEEALEPEPEPVAAQQRALAQSSLEDFTRKIERKKERELAELQFAGGDGSAGGNKPVVQGQKVGRNDPCPCGSGKKYKKCHGA